MVNLLEMDNKSIMIHGSGIKLIIEEEDMKDIMKIIEALENSGILLKGFCFKYVTWYIRS